MICPYCGGATKIKDTRKEKTYVMRIRVCNKNKLHRFKTVEKVMDPHVFQFLNYGKENEND